MDCPTDGCRGTFRVTHTFSAKEAGVTQRRECPVCLAVGMSVVVLVAVDPEQGKGASALARKLASGESRLLVTVREGPQSPTK